ncbi:MAG: hypothetical protein ACRDRS_06940 [Pseudonocardiaceae bacterium]
MNVRPLEPADIPWAADLLESRRQLYDPGGAVLLADRVAVEAELAILEREAAHLGAVLAVVPSEPHAAREKDLRLRNWTVASQWYLGQPQAAAT